MKISAVAAIVVALGGVAMIMDGVKGGPWDAEQVLLLGRVVFLGLVGLCIYMAPTGVATNRRHPQLVAICAHAPRQEA